MYRRKSLWKNPSSIRTGTTAAMGKSKGKGASQSNVIATNRKARHDYRIEETLEAGAGPGRLGGEEACARVARNCATATCTSRTVRRGFEAPTSVPCRAPSTHVDPQPTRARKLLLHRPGAQPTHRRDRKAGVHRHRTQALLDDGAGPRRSSAPRTGSASTTSAPTERDRDWQRQRERLIKRPG